ncbi:alpha/beta hydrolase [Neolewinella lacunae]|uniref:Alpha/beta hydrolase n=1 Tax=Neolewinella lacunae TaxID=1517758 RepID=A0A923PKW4_9BACT|nr:alpha/beta hydrolase [Neolewinella lacunae]MBC6995234.1 alpha/beta hydrolase [Neolewinella lacunae]MDN3635457.1 alpha/beta hydrolase [Neolewinella lacunae]
MRKLLYFLAAVVVLYLGITYYFSSLILHTPDRDLATVYQMNEDRWNLDLDSLLQTLPPREEIEFRSPYDGITLRGWLFLPDSARCGVVMAHGYSVNRANMLKYAPIFDSCRCAMLLYDHRGHGGPQGSDEAPASGGYHEATDLIAASDFLAARTGLAPGRIGWFGESWGGAAVIMAAARASRRIGGEAEAFGGRAKAATIPGGEAGASGGRAEAATIPGGPAWVVAESPFADWESAVMERGLKEYGVGLNLLTPGAFAWVGYRAGVDFSAVSTVQAAAELEVPLLLFHSLADTLTGPGQADEIAAATPADLLTYHALDWGAWHAHNIIWDRQAYTQLVLDFLGDWCQRSPAVE